MYKRIFMGWLLLICLLLSGCYGKKSFIYQADKSALYAVLKKSAEIKEERYTTASYDAFYDAILDGSALAEDENALQTQVDQAVAEIYEQINSLREAKQGVYLIETELEMIVNHSVGNEWTTSVYCNGNPFDAGEELIADLNTAVTLTAKIVERDTVPDRGQGSVQLTLKDGSSASKIITVQESRGRYSGNKAQWEMKCTVTLLRRI